MKAVQHVRPLVLTAALAALAVGALSLVAGPATGSTHKPSREVVVVNDQSNPVQVGASTPLQVAASSPLAVTPPLWPGTPFMASKFGRNHGGESCHLAFTASPGTAVLLTTVSGSFHLPFDTGAGGIRVDLTTPDGSQQRSHVPMHQSAAIPYGPGSRYDRYQGSLALDGFPVIEAAVCLTGRDMEGELNFFGFTVPLPEPPR